jgi:hypothetical protein
MAVTSFMIQAPGEHLTNSKYDKFGTKIDNTSMPSSLFQRHLPGNPGPLRPLHEVGDNLVPMLQNFLWP